MAWRRMVYLLEFRPQAYAFDRCFWCKHYVGCYSQVVVECTSGLAFIALLRNSQEFGRFFQVQAMLLPVYSDRIGSDRSIVGLLGTPSRNDEDDWSDRDGKRD